MPREGMPVLPNAETPFWIARPDIPDESRIIYKSSMPPEASEHNQFSIEDILEAGEVNHSELNEKEKLEVALRLTSSAENDVIRKLRFLSEVREIQALGRSANLHTIKSGLYYTSPFLILSGGIFISAQAFENVSPFAGAPLLFATGALCGVVLERGKKEKDLAKEAIAKLDNDENL